jgi:hypothetical protein
MLGNAFYGGGVSGVFSPAGADVAIMHQQLLPVRCKSHPIIWRTNFPVCQTMLSANIPEVWMLAHQICTPEAIRFLDSIEFK